MKHFVDKQSIVRKIWGKADTVLFIFAGSAAEFALNKAVDWLYFTGKLPADPLGRLFSTVTYARQILFSEHDDAIKAINMITRIHQSVEEARNAQIPDWAYRDVLYMLIDYSVRSFELLERKLSDEEKQEVFLVFKRLGTQMAIKSLPDNYNDWLLSRNVHLQLDLVQSNYTVDLFEQYLKHLGNLRYGILKQVQVLLVPPLVLEKLPFDNMPVIKPVVSLYKLARMLKLNGLLKSALLPAAYKDQINAIDTGG